MATLFLFFFSSLIIFLQFKKQFKKISDLESKLDERYMAIYKINRQLSENKQEIQSLIDKSYRLDEKIKDILSSIK